MNAILTSLSNLRHQLLCSPYASIDTEYKINPGNDLKPYTLFAASIVDSMGQIKNRHIMDFQDQSQPEKELAKWLMKEILRYQLTIGWYSKGAKIMKDDGTYEGKDSDLKVLDYVCRYYNIPSIITLDRRGTPYVNGYDIYLCSLNPYYRALNKFGRYYHIDLYQVYKKLLVRQFVYNNKYKSLSLDSVCRAILGEGKYENLDGRNIQTLSKKEQLEYVTQDARLVMKLCLHEDFRILNIMNAISMITGIEFDKVCHTGVSTWWRKIIEDAMDRGESKLVKTQMKKKKYSGGYVLEPKIGFYHNQPVYVFDVKSLYPSVMITHNISFDTVNCDCCIDASGAYLTDEVMDLINCNLPDNEKRNSYWICQSSKYRGIVPRLLQQYRDERFRQQELGNDMVQLALKYLINGCYGLFGTDFFEFNDYRVAELTTAIGRLTLQQMQHIAKEVYGFDIIYGDTDSLFVTTVNEQDDIKKFITECYILLGMDVELADVYKKFLVTKKKHYIGIPLDEMKDPVIRGMEGIKGDRPLWINKIERQLAEDIKNDKDPTINIKKEYVAMEEGLIPIDNLEIKLTLAKNPDEYSNNSLQKVVGTELDAHQGDVIQYYKSNLTGGGTSNSNLISRKKYLEMLQTAVEDSLTVMGYDYLHDIVGFECLDKYDG